MQRFVTEGFIAEQMSVVHQPSSPRMSSIDLDGFDLYPRITSSSTVRILSVSSIPAESPVSEVSASELPQLPSTVPSVRSTNWHNGQRDTSIRRKILKLVLHLLLQRRPSTNPIWQEKLLKIAKKLELRLYCQALSVSEYQDENTIRARLQSLASHVLQFRRENTASSSSNINYGLTSRRGGDRANGRLNSHSRVVVRRFVLHRICPAA